MKLRFAATTAVVLLSITPGILHGDYWYGSFQDSLSASFSDDAVIFAEPSIDADVIQHVPIGTEIVVHESAGDDTFDGSFQSSWFEVKCTVDGSECSGYMPAKYLAMSVLELDPETLFLFNVTGYVPEEFRFVSSARIIEDGSVKAEHVFRPVSGGFGQGPYSYSISSTELSAEGLSGVRNLIELSFIYEACGFMNRDMLFAWSGEELFVGPYADLQYEAGIYHYDEYFIMPSDSTGRADEVRVLAIVSEWDDSTAVYIETERNERLYEWDGGGFEQIDDQE